MLSVVGIGVPSKYFDFPVASLGRAWTVTLNRASRVRPHKTKKVRMRWSTGERRPMANAATAGDTPKETCYCNIPISHYMPHSKYETINSKTLTCSTSGEATQREGKRKTHQIGQRIQFLAHQTALLPPPRNLPVHKVEEQAEGHKHQRGPKITVGTGLAETIPHG
jgi:hypothetical protein